MEKPQLPQRAPSSPPMRDNTKDWKARPITPPQGRRLLALASKNGWRDEQVAELVLLKLGCSIAQLPSVEYDAAVDYVQTRGPETLEGLRLGDKLVKSLESPPWPAPWEEDEGAAI